MISAPTTYLYLSLDTGSFFNDALAVFG